MLFQNSYTYLYSRFLQIRPRNTQKSASKATFIDDLIDRLSLLENPGIRYSDVSVAASNFFLRSLTDLKYFFVLQYEELFQSIDEKQCPQKLWGVQMNPPKGARAPHWSRSAPFLKNTIPGKSALFKQNS